LIGLRSYDADFAIRDLDALGENAGMGFGLDHALELGPAVIRGGRGRLNIAGCPSSPGSLLLCCIHPIPILWGRLDQEVRDPVPVEIVDRHEVRDGGETAVVEQVQRCRPSVLARFRP
jgi:hypothetical protein